MDDFCKKERISPHRLRANSEYCWQEVRDMSPKELLYIEDALGHEKFLKTQCQQAMQNLTDPELKNYVQQLMTKHQELFDQFYQLV